MNNSAESVKNTHSVKDTHGLPFQPLLLWLPEPRRRALAELPGGRRPVVAILDLAVSAHPWFDTRGDADDPILLDATMEGPDAWTSTPGPPWHGTFVAGLIRQNAPDARILSVPLAATREGIVGGELQRGLEWLHTWMAGGPDRFVDVLSIAVGFPLGQGEDHTYADTLMRLIQGLYDRG